MHRVITILLCVFTLLAVVAAADKVRRIGVIVTEVNQTQEQPFWDRMRELGWINGQTVTAQRRAFGDRTDLVPALARDLMQSGIDVFVVQSAGVATRIREITKTVPIVTVAAGDLVEAGLAHNLAHPGSNVTGVQVLQVELAAKRLALLKEAIPGLSRVGLLLQLPGTEQDVHKAGIYGGAVTEFEQAAPAIGIHLVTKVIRDAEELEAAFSFFRKNHLGAVVVFTNVFMSANRKLIAELCFNSRMPAMADSAEWVEEGMLLSYYTDFAQQLQLAAGAVDSILRGASAGDIPIQQPTRLRLSVNMKTAKALGLVIPDAILAQADVVIN